MMMFADIIKYVEEKEYQLAVDALTPLLKNEDEKIVAKAHHILGYINTRHDYTEKSEITIFARGLMTYSSVTNMLAIKERNSVVFRFWT